MTTKKKSPRRKGTKRKTSVDAMRFLDSLIDEPMTFARTLRSIRETDELTQADVAAFVGATQAHISDIEKGRKLVGPERAARFAEVLGYSEALFVQLALQDQVRSAGLNMTVRIEGAQSGAC